MQHNAPQYKLLSNLSTMFFNEMVNQSMVNGQSISNIPGWTPPIDQTDGPQSRAVAVWRHLCRLLRCQKI